MSTSPKYAMWLLTKCWFWFVFKSILLPQCRVQFTVSVTLYPSVNSAVMLKRW